MTKQDIIDLESQVLMEMSFEVKFPSIVDPLKRYMRLFDYNEDHMVGMMAY